MPKQEGAEIDLLTAARRLNSIDLLTMNMADRVVIDEFVNRLMHRLLFASYMRELWQETVRYSSPDQLSPVQLTNYEILYRQVVRALFVDPDFVERAIAI